ncbi:hypothetical protein I350_05549 [Cryptococcus amylolentus CBS 6273]|uniref:BD-FAE-like domain-containing protein n=1 Tax=Cryptococcus amylolentus CBS 6273 TaxID=1296118 RepID=A0A1E3JVQ9_9TREE|nr:hypothetical protein I350_05549 [Cryptococcus amylolentus CBS 6273]
MSAVIKGIYNTFLFDSEHGLQLDAIYPTSHPQDARVPVFVHYHGGGMAAGSRRDMFFAQEWMRDILPSKGFLVIFADYRLLYPSTADDIITDVHTLFSYISDPNTELAQSLASLGITIDASHIVVNGASGGNYAAKAAATLPTVIPRPIAWVDLWGQGGNWFSDSLVKPYDITKYTVGLLYDEARAIQLEEAGGGEVVTDDPFVPLEGGKRSDKLGRFSMVAYWLRQGTFLDHLFSAPGLGAKLAAVEPQHRPSLIPPERVHLLLPITPITCPAYLIHGTTDKMCPISESKAIERDMKQLGLEVVVDWVENGEHGLWDTDTRKPVATLGETIEKVVAWVEEKARA